MLILASDYDGTLNRGGISERDRAAVKAFRKAGNLFGIVTGRDARFYETITNAGMEIDFILALNGAMTVSAVGDTAGEITHSDFIEKSGLLRGVSEIVFPYGAWLSYADGRKRQTFHPDHPEGNEKYAPHADMDAVVRFNSMNTWLGVPELARECAAKINAAFGQYVNALQNYDNIDIPPAGIDKGEGLRRFAALRNIPENCIYTAGDNMNDMAMIRRFHGCAVENACPEIKAAAEGVYPDIAAMIEMLLDL